MILKKAWATIIVLQLTGPITVHHVSTKTPHTHTDGLSLQRLILSE